MTALQQDTMRIRQELKKSKQIIKTAQQETEAAKRKAFEAEQAAERKLTIAALNMLKEGMSIEAVAKCLELPVEAIRRIDQQFGQGKRD